MARDLTDNTILKNKGAFISAAIAVAGAVALLGVSHTAFGISYGYGTGYANGPTQNGAQPVYRTYSATTGDHLLTISPVEKSAVVTAGMTDEGTAFAGYTAAPKTGSAVYRSFNTKTGDHFYTSNLAEYVNAMTVGYNLEGVGFYEYASQNDPETTVQVGNAYRSLSTNGGLHHLFTTSAAESAAFGTSEGTAFYVPTN